MNQENNNEDYELSEEEAPTTQRFSIVVVWSPNSGAYLSPNDMQRVIEDTVLDMDDEAVVEVTEIVEPAY